MSRWSEEFLESMRKEMDPVADDCVHALFQESELSVIASFHGDLVDDTGKPKEGLPGPMVEYLNRTSEMPDWVDPEKLRIGDDVLNSHGGLVLLIHGCASLPECYVDHLGMPVLFLTQKLNRNIERRVVETIKFVEDVHSERGFMPTGSGLDTARKVRLMHAAVRYLILHKRDERLAEGLPPSVAEIFRNHSWQEKLGKPINQEDLAYTLQTFAWVVIRGLRDLKAGLDKKQEEAIVHCWNVAGHFLGVREDLLPQSVAEAEEIFASIKGRVKGESPEGKSMTAAVMDFAEKRLPVPYFAAAPTLLSRYLVGDETADMLGLPQPTLVERSIGRRWLLELTFLVHFWEKELRSHPLLRTLSAKILHGILGLEVDKRARADGSVPFTMPDALAKNWSINPPEKK